MTPLIKTKPRCGAYGSLDNRCHIRPSLTKQNRSGSMPSVDWLGEHRTGGSAAPEYSESVYLGGNVMWINNCIHVH